MISEHERVLLASAQAGDHEAFATLYAVLTPGLTRFVRRLIGDAQDVDDVTQDTLFALYTHLPTLDPPEKLRPFLFRVARNRCTDILRRQGRYELVSVDLDEDDYGTVRVGFEIAELLGESTPEDATGWLLLMVEVRDAMDRLSENQRQTLILFCEEGLAYDEIALVMDVSIGTVKSRLFHARRGLRGLLRSGTLDAIDDMLELGEPVAQGGGVGSESIQPANNDDIGEREPHHDTTRHSDENSQLRERDAGAAKIDGTVVDAGHDGRRGRTGGARVSGAARQNRRTAHR